MEICSIIDQSLKYIKMINYWTPNQFLNISNQLLNSHICLNIKHFFYKYYFRFSNFFQNCWSLNNIINLNFVSAFSQYLSVTSNLPPVLYKALHFAFEKSSTLSDNSQYFHFCIWKSSTSSDTSQYFDLKYNIFRNYIINIAPSIPVF